MSERLRGALAEALGTAFLLASIVGSGIMAEELTDDVGLQLLQNALATAGVLGALIFALGPVSGAHFNPAVSLAAWLLGIVDRTTAAVYAVAQVAGGLVGVVVANLMFDLPAVSTATTERTGSHLWLSEVVATLGLVALIFFVVRRGEIRTVAITVAGYVAGAYYFTASTGFANPAVSIGRSITDTFTGIAPGDVAPFLVAQLAGALLAVAAVRVLAPADAAGPEPAEAIVAAPGGRPDL